MFEITNASCKFKFLLLNYLYIKDWHNKDDWLNLKKKQKQKTKQKQNKKTTTKQNYLQIFLNAYYPLSTNNINYSWSCTFWHFIAEIYNFVMGV